MKKQHLFLLVALMPFMMFSCKTPQEFMDSIKVTPNPMELHAKKVSVSIEGTFPEKYFKKKLILRVTPVLISNTTGTRYEGTPKIFQGEKVDGNGAIVNYKAGGKIGMDVEFDYHPDMQSSSLYLEAEATLGKKQFVVEATKVADGIIITPLMVSCAQGELNTQINPDKFQRVIEQKQEAEIKFLISQSNIRSSETKSEAMVALTKVIRDAQVKQTDKKGNLANDSSVSQQIELKGLEISSYASPDGKEEMNEKLAKNRKQASEQYLKGQMKKIKSNIEISSNFTAEDWDGFKTLMEQSNIQDKEVILSVLSRYTDPEEREAQIKMLSSAYKEIAETVLPELRRSKMTLTSQIIGKSDSLINALRQNNPEALTLEELLYSATLTNLTDEQKAIYNKAMQLYPEDTRAYNNMGVVYYTEGNYEEAGRMFQKVLSMDDKNPVYNYNNGVMALYNDDTEKAEMYLGNSGGVGANLNIANGVLHIKKASYNDAVSDFGNTKSNNAALARILNKDYSGARSILENIEKPNGDTYYLMAIVGARTNNSDMVMEYMAKAIQENNSYMMMAAKDQEFAAFAENAAFKALLGNK